MPLASSRVAYRLRRYCRHGGCVGVVATHGSRPPELQVPLTGDTVDVAMSRATAEAEALQRLRELVPDEARLYCKLHTDVREGRADRTLVETAIERHADLIVMGIQSHNVLDRLVFGSNLHTVLRAAPCPVLAVPAVKAASQIKAA